MGYTSTKIKNFDLLMSFLPDDAGTIFTQRKSGDQNCLEINENFENNFYCK